MDAMELLLGRSSATALGEPGPTEEALDKMIRSALRAPDHGRLRPWRFVVVRESMREKFSEVLADFMKRTTPDASPEMLERERAKAMRAPMIVVSAHRPNSAAKIPAVEQMIAVAAATQNIMLAAHALGYGAMWKTGGAAYDHGVKVALGLTPSDAIIGFLYIGTRVQLAKPVRQAPRPEPREFMADWCS